MSEPMAGVHVCLIGKNGSAVLHRIPPVNDPLDRLNMMRDICSSVSLTSLAVSAQGSLPPYKYPRAVTCLLTAGFTIYFRSTAGWQRMPFFCLRLGCCGYCGFDSRHVLSKPPLFPRQVGDEVGADCSILGSLDDPSAPSQKATVIKQRFQVWERTSARGIAARCVCCWLR